MRTLTFLASTLFPVCWLGTSVCGATFDIDFGPAFGAPATDVDLTNQLQAYGITFSSYGPNPVQWHGTNPDVSSYPYCISGGWYPPGHPNEGDGVIEAIRVDFSPYVIEASVRGYDGGGDSEIMLLQAYNALDVLVDSAQVSSDFAVPGEVLSVSALEIAYITFEVQQTTSGLFFDDLTYTQVPEPLSFLLLGLGAMALRRH